MQMPIEPGTGQPAPGFRAPTSHGQTLDSETFHGKLAVVLFFLTRPGSADDEVLLDSFDEHLVDFGHERVQLLGVAPCSPRALRDRAEAQQLAVTILADESGEIARTFGVSAAVGDPDALAPPATVVIDRRGVIAARVPRTDAPHHVEDVLEELRRLEDAIDAGDRPDVSLRPRTARSDR
ncbi:MAG TPA: redoxin domain-containing protein [Acidimicrobiia bacterium]|jgi:peroxiredoxin